MYKIVDFESREEVFTENMIYCDGDRPWEIVMDMNLIRKRFNMDYFMKSDPLLSKYLHFLPINDYSNLVTLSEGTTPLLRSKYLGPRLGIDLYFKTDYRNPTGSFKDRGSAVELTVAKEMGAKAIAVASTGNMAASCSCYAAAAGIPCFVFVPEDTPSSKLSQVISYGGKIVQVKGKYNDAAKLAENVCRELGFYLAGDYAFRVEGQKTAAFELVDQLRYNPPEMVLVPMGCGTNLTGYAKGFQEYLSLGIIKTLPKLIGTQAEGAASIVNAFNAGHKDVTPLASVNTIASAISIERPIDAMKALAGIYESNGAAIAVSDREILEAQYQLSQHEGLFIEASSATAVAVLKKMLKNGDKPNGPVVCVLTGDGLKDPKPILRMAIKPPTIDATVEGFVSLYERAFFEGRTVTFSDSSTVVFTEQPSDILVEEYLIKFLGMTLKLNFRDEVRKGIGKFLLKGKSVTLSDLQDLVQKVISSSTDINDKFKVLDFEVITGKDKKPRATVSVNLGGIEYSGISEGVGPVDAVISALRSACSDKLNFKLVNFEVVIRASGTDAVVNAEMSLENSNGASTGRSASPDVIQASIEAFEIAFNGLI